MELSFKGVINESLVHDIKNIYRIKKSLDYRENDTFIINDSLNDTLTEKRRLLKAWIKQK